jgi:hypothetical protein
MGCLPTKKVLFVATRFSHACSAEVFNFSPWRIWRQPSEVQKDLESTLVPFFESVEWGDEREAHRIAAKQASSGYGQFRKRPVQKTARSKNVGNPTLLSTVALWVTRGRRLGKDF